jgi:rhodanese-related sulfurtransferase
VAAVVSDVVENAATAVGDTAGPGAAVDASGSVTLQQPSDRAQPAGGAEESGIIGEIRGGVRSAAAAAGDVAQVVGDAAQAVGNVAEPLAEMGVPVANEVAAGARVAAVVSDVVENAATAVGDIPGGPGAAVEGPIAGTEWERLVSDEGDLYFHHTVNGEVTWEVPPEVKAVEEGTLK